MRYALPPPPSGYHAVPPTEAQVQQRKQKRRRCLAIAGVGVCVVVAGVGLGVGLAVGLGQAAGLCNGWGGDLTAAKAAVLQKHNAYRAMHGVPALVWDAQLANDAAAWTCKCIFAHQDPLLATQGENLYEIMGSTDVPAAVEAAPDDWYAEVAQYDYGSPGFSEATGHFTQMVWRDTTAVGCGASVCDGGNGVIVSCRYTPPGNVIGEDWSAEVPPSSR